MQQRLWDLYECLSLRYARWSIASIVLLIGVSLWYYAPDFKLDASADSLVLENDADLKYYRQISTAYGSDSLLVIAYTPTTDIFSKETLQKIKTIRNDLLELDGISKVLTIGDVPLFNSPAIPLNQLAKTTRTLETPDIDYALAKKELTESPLYRELLLSKDAKTSVILAYLKTDETYQTLLERRSELRELFYNDEIDSEQAEKLEEVESLFKAYQADHAERERHYIHQVREVLDQHRNPDLIFLGGAPMIVADMISFIRSDLINFGIAIIIFLTAMLAIIFRQMRWVVLPIVTCGAAVVAMFAVLGWLDWRITVISANFASLLLIITMSMTIHIVVRYRENQVTFPNHDKRQLIQESMRFMLKPCFYTSLTTVTAFISLVVSDIRPVIDFGYIMTVGIVLAFLLTFLLLPAILMLLPQKASPETKGITHHITNSFAYFTHHHHWLIVAVALAIATLSVIGVSQLKVENRFIDYFHEDTEIYQGMLKIDQELGGTIPLDLILNAPVNDAPAATDNEDDLEDDWEDDLLGDYLEDADAESAHYWLTAHKFKAIKKLHAYFEAQPEIGKVISLATLIQLAEPLNDNKPLSDLQAPLLSKFLSADIRELLLDPYLSADGNQLRFTMRVIDSNKQLNRQSLLERINRDLKTMGYDQDQFRLTGKLVLYNNMLQSLYQSQILTLGMVFLAILLMFIILFHSLSLAVLAIIPNFLAAGLVLGFMGWRGIPLDIMTITIAAISIGIAVDNTIHYVVRFKRELPKDNDYFATIKRCHNSIGKAVYYTSSIIVIGFAILSLSNFIPSVYFGLLVGLAMFTALIATLTLLPALLLIFKPIRNHSSSVDTPLT